jgi:hypothetical protein
MAAKTSVQQALSESAGVGAYVENDPGLVRQRPSSATVDARDGAGQPDQDDPPAEWTEKEQLDEPILLQAQRLLEAAGSVERAVAAIEKAGQRGA